MNSFDPGAILANQELAALGESQLAIQADNTAIPNPILNAQTNNVISDLAAIEPTLAQGVAGAASGVRQVGDAIQSGFTKAGSMLENLGSAVGKTAGNVISGVFNWKVFLIVAAVLIAAVIVLPKIAKVAL